MRFTVPWHKWHCSTEALLVRYTALFRLPFIFLLVHEIFTTPTLEYFSPSEFPLHPTNISVISVWGPDFAASARALTEIVLLGRARPSWSFALSGDLRMQYIACRRIYQGFRYKCFTACPTKYVAYSQRFELFQKHGLCVFRSSCKMAFVDCPTFFATCYA